MGDFYTSPSPECKTNWELREKAMLNNASWIFQKTPWVMVTSMQEIYGAPEARLNHVLFCGEAQQTKGRGIAAADNLFINSNFEWTYESEYNRPIPGLTDITVEYKGSMGSTREVKAKFKVWTDDQMEIYELLYLIPGAGVRVEWGWSLDPNGNPVTPIGTKVMDNFAFEELANQKEIDFGGHYGGQQGLVTSFSWTKQGDGSYDCDITICTVGEAYLQTPSATKRKRILKDNTIQTNTTPEDTGKEAIIQDILGVWQVIYKQSSNNAILSIPTKNILSKPVNTSTGTEELAGLRLLLRYDPPQEKGFWSKLWSGETDVASLPFVTMQFILTHMLNANTSDVIVSGTSTDGYPLGSNPEIRVTSKFEDDKPIWCQWRPNQVSINPFVCIIPGDTEPARYSLKTKSGVGIGKFTGVKDTWAGQRLEEMIFDHGRPGFIDLRWVLFNMDHLKKIIDETKTVDEALGRLLSDFNDSTGGILDLSLQCNNGLIRIVESATIKEEKPIPLIINLTTIGVGKKAGTNVRSFSMESDMTSKVASQVMYGNNNNDADSYKDHSAEKGESSTWTSRLYGAGSKNLALGGDGATTAPVANTLTDGQTTTDTPDMTMSDAINQVYWRTNPDTIQAAKTNLNEYLLWSAPNIHKSGETVVNFRPMLPIKLSFKCDGFTLFKTGYMLQPTFLPKRFQDFCEYMVMKTTHTITLTDFETDVELILRPKFKTQITGPGEYKPPYKGSYTLGKFINVATEPPKSNTSGTYVRRGSGPIPTTDKTRNNPRTGTSTGTSTSNTYFNSHTDNNPFSLVYVGQPGASSKWNMDPNKKHYDKNGKEIKPILFATWPTYEQGVNAGLNQISLYFTKHKIGTLRTFSNRYNPSGGEDYLQKLFWTLNKKLTRLPGNNKYKDDAKNGTFSTYTKLSFKGRTESNKENIDMFKALVKTIKQNESGADANVFAAIDAFDISKLTN